MMLKNGIVILNYNDSESVIQLTKNIIKYQNINNIIIVDNNSTDNSYQQLIDLNNTKCEIIRTDKNGGYAYGNNYGARYLIEKYSTDIIYISNPDVFFKDDLIKNLNKAFEKHQEYGILTGVMANSEGIVFDKPFWKIPTYLDDLEDCFYGCRARKRKEKNYIINTNKKIMTVDVVPGSFFGIRSDVYQNIGGFDENTFLFYEENILAKKIKIEGYYEGVLTDNIYYHLHSISIKKNLNLLKTHFIHLRSKYYYESVYNQISVIKKLILLVCEFYSMIETIILLPFKSLYRKIIVLKGVY